jgi:hypothetical protein
MFTLKGFNIEIKRIISIYITIIFHQVMIMILLTYLIISQKIVYLTYNLKTILAYITPIDMPDIYLNIKTRSDVQQVFKIYNTSIILQGFL